MPDLINFSNMGAGLDDQMNKAALAGQRLGVNDATLPGQIAATNAGNQAVVSNAGLQVNNNQRQLAFQQESASLAADPNATAYQYQALANKYPEFGQQVAANLNQAQANWGNERTKATAAGIQTAAAVYARLQSGDTQGALDALEQQAVRQENSGDVAGAASTRSHEAAIVQNPAAAKQFLAQWLNTQGANTPGQAYGNQVGQAGATVAQNSVPAAIAQNNASASLAGTNAAYAAPTAQANIGSVNANTGLTTANTGIANQQLTGGSPTAIAASQPDYLASTESANTAAQAENLASLFSQAAKGGTTSGLLGATWDNVARKWTGDMSTLQQYRQDAQSMLAKAEMSQIVGGNFTDAATARAVQAVPTITDSPQTWATYMLARQKFLTAQSSFLAARGDWQRGNNGSAGPAYRDMTIQGPNGTSMFVKQGESFGQFSKKAALSYYTNPSSFDPTQ